ncbi:succinylglutamate desuccinylase/aspartoacylase family protein [Calditrichota bacterium LG25]
MKQEKVQWIYTGQSGVLRLDIPVLTFGAGKPKLVITSSVHGDEPLGLAVMSQLVDYLRRENLKGTVSLVLAANPAAQFVAQRVSPQDFKDLNRVGSGNHRGYYTDRLGARLFDFFKEFDFVVNIHEFEMHTPVTTFFLNEGSIAVKRKILEGIQAFYPEIVWIKKETNERDSQYKNTLDAALANAGIPGFIVEAVQLPFITDREIDRVLNGLIRLTEYLGILPSKSFKATKENNLPYFYRNEFTSDIAGYWEPEQRDILTSIKKGDVIGRIKTLPDFETKPIVAPFSGTLIQLRHRQLVGTGTSLFSIGTKPEKEMDLKFENQ